MKKPRDNKVLIEWSGFKADNRSAPPRLKRVCKRRAGKQRRKGKYQ